MTKSDIQNPAFTDEDKARETLEAIRWPDGAHIVRTVAMPNKPGLPRATALRTELGSIIAPLATANSR
jgi:hypothetical protein